MTSPPDEDRLSVGVDLGGTKCLGVLTDGSGRVLAEQREPTPRGRRAVVEVVAGVAASLAGRGGPGVAGVGVGAPGLVDERGVLRYAPNLPGVEDLDLRGPLTDRLEMPVVVENDASCAGWAEHQAGAGRGRRHMVMATLGTGIGGGIVLDGRLYRGHHGFAGEIGHMVVDPHGPPCPCGQRGCWERFASGSGLGRLGRDAAHAGRAAEVVAMAGGDPEDVRGEHVTTAAANGDEQAGRIMDEFGWWVAAGLANLANVFDPEVFVLGGGLVEAGPVLFEPVRRAFATLVEGAGHRPPITVVAAELGEHAGAVGAALLAGRDR